jgi:hypothetical protein
MTAYRYFLVACLLCGGILFGGQHFGPAPAAAQDSTKDVLAAQIREQGVACDQPQRAVRDAKRSRPDYDVWILTCKNATYRVSRYPDMAAKIVKIR